MTTPNDSQTGATRHQQLAALADELNDLRARYDLLMNAFKFDEARVLHFHIEAAERQHRELAATLPAALPPVPAPTPYHIAMRRGRRR
jgi:hypothetical protein